MGNGVIPTKWFNEIALQGVPIGKARRGQRRPKIFEGVDYILRERDPRKGICSYEFSVLKEVRAIVKG